jgi:hypothetical protein
MIEPDFGFSCLNKDTCQHWRRFLAMLQDRDTFSHDKPEAGLTSYGRGVWFDKSIFPLSCVALGGVGISSTIQVEWACVGFRQ